ncbi:stage II sporulation protein M [Paenibacillus phyllosphaerae]|uniref:Stage II sporulation protein M n=1 Tax=Paenibacillus phyllosphaerae TaxID=274593 RepID=A0A7W5AV19_9BACL|nr:stage II sporulation protein M [Paenibacillus phyllosphaerae]MBB3109208.1 stage II sporulation protein M [Paenibacillus phyllosphaerae]
MGTSLRGSLLRDQLTLYVFVSVLFVVGVVFGSLLVSALTLDQQQNLAKDVEQFVLRIQDGSSVEGSGAFWERVLFHAKWLMLIWVLGITVIGVPLVLALDFLKGVLVGFAIGTLVSQHDWKGLLFALTSVAPPNLIVVPAILIASVSALSFALSIVKGRLLGKAGPLAEPFISHTSTLVLMVMITGLAALLEAFVTPELLRWAAPLLTDASSGL